MLLSKNNCFVKKGGRFFQILWPSHNIWTLTVQCVCSRSHSVTNSILFHFVSKLYYLWSWPLLQVIWHELLHNFHPLKKKYTEPVYLETFLTIAVENCINWSRPDWLNHAAKPNGTCNYSITDFVVSCSKDSWLFENYFHYDFKAEFMQEGIFFVLQLFAWWILLIKKLEIEKTKPTFIISVLKVEY